MQHPVALSALVDDAKDVVARLRMDRSARRQGVIVVEGPTDEVVLGRAFPIDRRSIFPVRGRVNVLRVVEELLGDPLAGVICIADRDFDAAESERDSAWFLVFYDDADLEAMLVNTDVFDRLLEEWGSAQKLAAVGGSNVIRDRIQDMLMPIGALRAANAEKGWGLRFSDLPLPDLVDKKEFALPRERLLLRLAQGSSVAIEEIREAADEPPPYCPQSGRPLIAGSDLMAVVGVALRQLVGSLSKQQVADAFVERMIRRMVGAGDLDGTAFAGRLDDARAKAVREAASI